jgi:DNA-binding NtrC family response regulator
MCLSLNQCSIILYTFDTAIPGPLKQKRKRLFFVLEENPVYRHLIPMCVDSVNEESDIRVFDNPGDMLLELPLKPDLLISEYAFSGDRPTGREILNSVKKRSPGTKIIFLTAHHNLKSAISALKSGAYDYIPKSKTALDSLIRKLVVYKNHEDAVYFTGRQIKWSLLYLLLLFLALLGLVIGYSMK